MLADTKLNSLLLNSKPSEVELMLLNLSYLSNPCQSFKVVALGKLKHSDYHPELRHEINSKPMSSLDEST